MSGVDPYVHSVAVVIPVYRGELSLPDVLREIEGHFTVTTTPGGRAWKVTEVVLVHDRGPDRSADVIRSLAKQYPAVTPVWLSRNFGQHAATLAGINCTAAAWVVTMDEDGQHEPSLISLMLDAAMDQQLQLVYAAASDGAPHAAWRNLTSRVAKRLMRIVAGGHPDQFTSFRLVLGSHARSVAAYCAPGMYLDVALGWAVDKVGRVAVPTRPEWREGSSYNLRRLLSHFWSLVLSSGTRPLRIIALIGSLVAAVGFIGAAVVVVQALSGDYSDVDGWASMIVTLLVLGGLLLLALGVIAEYLGAVLRAAQGQPVYIVVDDPSDGPLAS